MLGAVKALFESCFATDAGETPNPTHAIQLATAALLIELSRADAEVSVEEEQTIAAQIKQHFTLSEQELSELLELADAEADQAISLHDFTRALNDHLTREQRVQVVEQLWRVANADGRIDKYEDHYIRKVTDLLYVSHADFIRTKHRVIDA